MKPISFILISLCLFGMGFSVAMADDHVFARQGDQVLTQGELDAAFAEIPEAHRLAFIRDGGKVDQLVQKLFRARQVAAAARAEGFDQDPLVVDRLKLAREEALARMWVQQVVADAPEADYKALAEEYYLAHPDEFYSAETLDVSHILISTESRSEENALALVADLEKRLAEDPGRFDELVMEMSEDPAKETNKGRYAQMIRGQMVKPFEEAAFALQDAGEISNPVKTDYGYHVIRLNRRIAPELMPFTAIEAQLIERAKQQYLAEYRQRYIVNQTSQPIELPEGAVETMLKRHFGENLENAPAYQE